ncbi:MAG: hypothetical protein E7333_02360 [Clostridiales bacterium]|nr:hypothetical protein [Clostridiales bacterium]
MTQRRNTPLKFALIGQDIPTLLPGMLTDLLFVGKEAARVFVEEKNSAMQQVLQGYGDAVIAHSGIPAVLTVTGNRADVLRDADCVIYAGDCMAASRFRQDREALSGVEEDDPGLIDQARVNGGIGGLMHALRQGETVLSLAEDMEKYCPGALVVNLGQPVARTTAMFLNAGFRCYGLGRTPLKGANGLDMLCRKVHRKPEEASATIAGLPGFSFLLDMKDKTTGEDLLSVLKDLAETGDLGRLTKRWMDWYGALAVGDVTDHAEFLPAQEDFIPEEQPEFGETVERRKERILYMNTVSEKGAAEQEGMMAQWLLLSKAPPVRPMQLALALVNKSDADIPAVTRRNGRELPQLSPQAVIESALTLRGGGEVPHGILMPDDLADICGEVDEVNRLAALAAAGDRSALREYVDCDPALAGLDRLYLQEMVDKLIELHDDVIVRL